jgi:hypothetical protein
MLDREKVYAAVELRFTGDEQKANLSGIIRGKLVDGTVTGIAHAANLPETKKNKYDLRILDIRGINYPLLWLHSDDEKIDDLFLGRNATPAERKRKPAYTAQDIKDVFGEQAATNLRFFRAAYPCPTITAPANCD